MSPGPAVASDLAISTNSSLPSLATKIKANQWETNCALQHSLVNRRLLKHVWCFLQQPYAVYRPLAGEQEMESI